MRERASLLLDLKIHQLISCPALTHTHTHPEPCSVCVWSIRTMKTASMTESDDSSCLSVSNNTPGLTTSFFLGKISLKPTQSKTQRVREL